MNSKECFICSKKPPGYFIQCQFCGEIYCSSCCKIHKLENTNKCFECLHCDLTNLLLLNNVITKLSNIGRIRTTPVQQQTAKLTIDCEAFEKFESQIDLIEIRCIKLDSRNYSILGEQTWPDKFRLHLNQPNNNDLNLEPVPLKSSLKKRKDEIHKISKINFQRQIKKYGQNMQFFMELETVLDDKNSFCADSGRIIYFWGVFGTKEITNIDFLLNSNIVRSLTEEMSKSYIQSLFSSSKFKLKKVLLDENALIVENKGLEEENNPDFNPAEEMEIENAENDEIQVAELHLDLYCMLTLTKLEIPVRGNKCQHLSCFGLKAYFLSINNSNHKKVYCPICGLTMQYFVYDKFIEKIIQKTDDQQSISFKSFGEMETILKDTGFKDNLLYKETHMIEMDFDTQHDDGNLINERLPEPILQEIVEPVIANDDENELTNEERNQVLQLLYEGGFDFYLHNFLIWCRKNGEKMIAETEKVMSDLEI